NIRNVLFNNTSTAALNTFINLVAHMIDPCPRFRYSWNDILSHEFFSTTVPSEIPPKMYMPVISREKLAEAWGISPSDNQSIRKELLSDVYNSVIIHKLS